MNPVENDPKAYGWRGDIAAKPPKDRTEAKAAKKTPSFVDLLRGQTDREASQAGQAAAEGQADQSEVIGPLLDEIHGLGEKLAKHQSSETIQAYKKALKKVIESFINQGLITEKHKSSRNLLQQKSYQMIRVIDEKLERLVVGVLQSQFSQIQILAKVEEIQGLLVNLLH